MGFSQAKFQYLIPLYEKQYECMIMQCREMSSHYQAYAIISILNVSTNQFTNKELKIPTSMGHLNLLILALSD
jgi:hypothetical protein